MVYIYLSNCPNFRTNVVINALEIELVVLFFPFSLNSFFRIPVDPGTQMAVVCLEIFFALLRDGHRLLDQLPHPAGRNPGKDRAPRHPVPCPHYTLRECSGITIN